MALKIGINGFGRIGRNVFRVMAKRKNIEVVAVNDITDATTLAYLLKYDSVHGILDNEVKAEGNGISVDGRVTKVLAEKDPGKLPWKDLGVDIVVESTGLFTKRDKAAAHLNPGGAKKVIISAPAEEEDVTICMGVNEGVYDKAKHHVISNASCTTNCVAPMAKVLNEAFGVVRGVMTTIHSYTQDQKLQDGPHKDHRRARAAALSMIPTSTGAAKAVGLVLPELKGKLDGFSMRVPTPNVSVTDLTCELKKATTPDGIRKAFKDAAQKNPYLKVVEQALVSVDFNGNPASCTFDAGVVYVIGDTLVKILGWYDNEMGYSTRVVDLAEYIASKGL